MVQVNGWRRKNIEKIEKKKLKNYVKRFGRIRTRNGRSYAHKWTKDIRY